MEMLSSIRGDKHEFCHVVSIYDGAVLLWQWQHKQATL